MSSFLYTCDVDRYGDSTQFRKEGKGKEVDNIKDTRYKTHNRVNHIVDRYKDGEGITRSKTGHLLLSILHKVNAKFLRRIIPLHSFKTSSPSGYGLK